MATALLIGLSMGLFTWFATRIVDRLDDIIKELRRNR